MNNKSLRKKLELLLEEFSPEWKNDPNMKNTPQRLTEMYMHFFRKDSCSEQFKKKFPSKDNQLIVVKDIECFGMCPHHLVPVIYKVHVGYKPNGWVLGLSKLHRIAVALSSYPKLQEDFTFDIVDVIFKELNPEVC